MGSIDVGIMASYPCSTSRRSHYYEYSTLMQAASGIGMAQPRASKICIAVSQEQAKRV